MNNRIAHVLYFIVILLVVQILAVGIAVALVAYGLITRPIKQISDHLRRLPAEQGAKLADPTKHEADEIGGLVNYINGMMDRLVGLLNEEDGNCDCSGKSKKESSVPFLKTPAPEFLRSITMGSCCPVIRLFREILRNGRSIAEPASGIAVFFDQDERKRSI